MQLDRAQPLHKAVFVEYVLAFEHAIHKLVRTIFRINQKILTDSAAPVSFRLLFRSSYDARLLL